MKKLIFLTLFLFITSSVANATINSTRPRVWLNAAKVAALKAYIPVADGGTGTVASTVGESATLKVEVSGTTATIYYKGVNMGTQSITVQGQYVGLYFDNGNNEYATVDNFIAGAL